MRSAYLLALTLVIAIAIAGASVISRNDMKAEGPPEGELPEAPSRAPETQRQAFISIKPEKIRPGEVAAVMIGGIDASAIREIVFETNSIPAFPYRGIATAFIPVYLKHPTGIFPVRVTLLDGRTLEKNLIVERRPWIERPLGVPDKLGGNTATSTYHVIHTITSDNAKVENLPTEPRALWTEPFIEPIPNAEVADVYGYTRQTNGYTITHKGTDYKADIGTEVHAMNSGIVRLAEHLEMFGGTVVIDHGLGLSTIYLHLSDIAAKKGEPIGKGEVLGRSGDTGYATAPHLHVSVKFGRESIDPEQFLKVFRDLETI